MGRQGGWILWELLAAAAIIIGLGWAVFAQSTALQCQYYRSQVRAAADILAADLRQLQQQSLFHSEAAGLTLKVTGTEAKGYGLYDGLSLQRRINFADSGCTEVYFSKKITSIYYSGNGSPSTSGTYVLRHRRLPGFSCSLPVEPVTGRVSVNEGK